MITQNKQRKMKKIFLIITALFISIMINAQVTNNFEDGNWLYYWNHCWGIGPNHQHEEFSTDVVGHGFSGTKVCQTDNLGHTNICKLESPWINLSVGNITFNHAVPSKDGNRVLKVYRVNQSNVATLLWSYTYTNGAVQNTSIPNSTTGIYKIRWQWTGNDGNSRGEIDDILINGINVSDPSNNCQPYITPTDTDGDGVPDTQDEYPIDPYRAYNNYFPAADTGTLAFEDLWPSYGDYDMNDLVVGYKFKIVSNAQHNVVEIYSNFIVRAQGAALHNGFGFELPDVASVSIHNSNGFGDQNGYNINSNGTEVGNSNATFIIFDDSHKFMSAWNTIKEQTPCPQVLFNIYIKFLNNGVPPVGGSLISLNTLNISEFNPFIVTNLTRGQEVHLPNYHPTQLADPSLFGTGNDDTNPAANKYYKSTTNLPWAINVYGKFNYPIEISDINSAYLHFSDWVQSDGTLYQDWWLNTQSGYRNITNIY